MNLNPFENDQCLHLENKQIDNDYFWAYEYEYKDLIKTITDKVDWKVESGMNDYQGDCFYFGEGNGKYYFLDFGYGSCSGCDALQSCDSYQDLLDLRDSLKRSVKEFYSLDEFEKWFKEGGKYQWWGNDVDEFISEMMKAYGVKLNFEIGDEE